MVAGSKRSRAKGDSTLIEALALRFALRNAIDSGIFNLQIETDSETLCKILRNEIMDNPVTMQIAEDILEMAKHLNCGVFLFAKREANMVAHTLSHLGKSDNFEEFWIEEIPSCCNDMIIKDVRREPTI